MTTRKLQKRENDFFVSYRHADLARVRELVRVLKDKCGLKLWLDDSDGNASARSSTLLAKELGNARGLLLCLSEGWKASSWCKDEHELALVERSVDKGFELLILQLDDVEPPDWLKLSEIINFRTLDEKSVARVLRSLASDVPHRFDNQEDVYVAAPWGSSSAETQKAWSALHATGGAWSGIRRIRSNSRRNAFRAS